MFFAHSTIIQGKDGIDLMHRISTLPLKHQSQLSPQMGFFLDPKGCVLNSFAATLTDSETLQILHFHSNSELLEKSVSQFRAVLDQYTFAERYEVKTSESTEWLEYFKDFSPTPNPSSLTLGQIFQSNERYSSEDCRLRCIEEMLPLQDLELNGKNTPIDCGYGSLFQQPKGCYPGQEVIEKIISLGSAPKKLCLLDVADSAAPKDVQAPLDVVSGSINIGECTQFASHHGKTLGLAVLRKSVKTGDEVKLKTKSLPEVDLNAIIKRVV